MNTESFSSSDLYDRNYSKDKMLNLRISSKTDSHETQGVTRATLGEDTINIADGSDVGNINRNINTTQLITKDKNIGGYDINVDIDALGIHQARAQLTHEKIKAVAESINNPNAPVESKNAATKFVQELAHLNTVLQMPKWKLFYTHCQTILSIIEQNSNYEGTIGINLVGADRNIINGNQFMAILGEENAESLGYSHSYAKEFEEFTGNINAAISDIYRVNNNFSTYLTKPRYHQTQNQKVSTPTTHIIVLLQET